MSLSSTYKIMFLSKSRNSSPFIMLVYIEVQWSKMTFISHLSAYSSLPLQGAMLPLSKLQQYHYSISVD